MPKIVMVTGATGELGREIVQLALQSEDIVLAVGSSREKLDKVFSALKEKRLRLYQVDLTRHEEVQNLFKMIIDDPGRIDILINCVGGYRGGTSFLESDINDWAVMMDLNLNSAYYLGRAALNFMAEKKAGSIVNISAMTSFEPNPQKAAYYVSKSGLNSLTQVMAEAAKPHNIRVNAIAPGVLMTPSTKKWIKDSNIGGWTTAEQIYNLVCYLSNEKNGMITGNIIKMPSN